MQKSTNHKLSLKEHSKPTVYVHQQNVHSSTVHNRPKLKRTQMPGKSRMNKLNVIYSYKEILYSNENVGPTVAGIEMNFQS